MNSHSQSSHIPFMVFEGDIFTSEESPAGLLISTPLTTNDPRLRHNRIQTRPLGRNNAALENQLIPEDARSQIQQHQLISIPQ
ncbi:hypothetical protein Nepgr_012446 [Nepenthes gracilis]|uniref:Uncharacterized protein n=1 Tax=Nepenthes gracilis TaxID=150966 RepID=A0AAD3XNC9_NEPGR|nr:hypothetical protein Nepgr_012446 [Nepenthes gracilis]